MTSRGLCVVIEDDEDISGLITFILTKEGFDVRPAASGADGMDAVARFGPALVTLDIGLPDTDGREVARQLRSITTSPILMITAVAGSGDELDGMAAGADAYLTKPFRPVELRAIVNRLCPQELAVGTPMAAEPAIENSSVL